VKKLFHWKGLKHDVEDFVKQCSVCQHSKHEHTAPAGLLQPLPIPAGAWQDISLDFIEGLPLSNNANVILVVVHQIQQLLTSQASIYSSSSGSDPVGFSCKIAWPTKDNGL
jgi:hypothetical protein